MVAVRTAVNSGATLRQISCAHSNVRLHPSGVVIKFAVMTKITTRVQMTAQSDAETTTADSLKIQSTALKTVAKSVVMEVVLGMKTKYSAPRTVKSQAPIAAGMKTLKKYPA